MKTNNNPSENRGGQTPLLLIFRTDIKTKKRVKKVKTLFNNHSGIKSWSVDTDDIDNVLRIEASEKISDEEIILSLRSQGFYSEVLED